MQYEDIGRPLVSLELLPAEVRSVDDSSGEHRAVAVMPDASVTCHLELAVRELPTSDEG